MRGWCARNFREGKGKGKELERKGAYKIHGGTEDVDEVLVEDCGRGCEEEVGER